MIKGAPGEKYGRLNQYEHAQRLNALTVLNPDVVSAFESGD